MNLLKLNALVVISIALSGCMTYKYNGRDFRSQADALTYQQQHLSEGLIKIPPAKNRIGGTLAMYYIDQETARSKVVTGNQTGVAADYVLKSLMADTEKVREAFARRNFFDKVDLKYANGLHRNAEPPQHVLYFFVESAQVASWYYIGQHVPRTPVAVDRGSKDVDSRLMYLIESVEALAAAENIASKRGTK